MPAPKKAPEDRYRTPPMQLGRVPVEVQDELRDAAQRSGKTFIAWALPILLRAARRKLP